MKNHKTTVSVNMHVETLDEIDKILELSENEVSRSAFIEEAVKQYIEHDHGNISENRAASPHVSKGTGR